MVSFHSIQYKRRAYIRCEYSFNIPFYDCNPPLRALHAINWGVVGRQLVFFELHKLVRVCFVHTTCAL